jgi:hypothetical protein
MVTECQQLRRLLSPTLRLRKECNFCFDARQSIHSIIQQHNAALQRPGDNCITLKLSMKNALIPVRCKRLFGGAMG